MLSGKALASNALGMADSRGSPWAGAPGDVAALPLVRRHREHEHAAGERRLLCRSASVHPGGGSCAGAANEASIWAAVPAMFAAMVESRVQPSDLKSIRMCISGGAPLAQRVRKAFEEKFGLTIYEGYGLTEASPLCPRAVTMSQSAPGASETAERRAVRIEPLPYHGDSP